MPTPRRRKLPPTCFHSYFSDNTLMVRPILTVMGVLLAATAVHAHPGHGVTDGNAPVHYLIELQHQGAAILAFAAIAILAGARSYRRSTRDRRR